MKCGKLCMNNAFFVYRRTRLLNHLFENNSMGNALNNLDNFLSIFLMISLHHKQIQKHVSKV